MPGVTKGRNKPQPETAQSQQKRFDETLRRMLNTPPQPKAPHPAKKTGKA